MEVVKVEEIIIKNNDIDIGIENINKSFTIPNSQSPEALKVVVNDDIKFTEKKPASNNDDNLGNGDNNKALMIIESTSLSPTSTSPTVIREVNDLNIKNNIPSKESTMLEQSNDHPSGLGGNHGSSIIK